LVDGVAEPDLDRGDVDGAAEDELAFVRAHRDRAELLELADGALDALRRLYDCGSNAGGRPPRGPLPARVFCWSTFSGMVAMIRRRRSSARIVRFE
jgi:hypothetical protein